LEGLGFYLNTQRAWTPQMIEKWKWISSEFIEKLYNTISAGKTGTHSAQINL